MESKKKRIIIQLLIILSFFIFFIFFDYNFNNNNNENSINSNNNIFFENSITGHATKIPKTATANISGGQVRVRNFHVPEYWRGYYGNLTENASDPTFIFVNGTFDGSNTVHQLNLNLIRCNNTEIYATNTSVSSLPNVTYINSISSAIKEGIDNYLGLEATDWRSGSATFTNLSRFDVGDDQLLMYSAQLLPYSGNNYWIGLMEDRRNNFVFVGNISLNSTSFANVSADYEIIIPIFPYTNITYYFFQDITDDCPFPTKGGDTSTPGSVTVPVPQGGSSTKFVEIEARCGNEICERLENCLLCPIDCGVCPVVKEVIYETKTVFKENTTKTIDQYSISKQYIIDNPQCTELKPLIEKADELLKQNKYAEALILLKQIVETCEDILSKVKPGFEFRVPLQQEQKESIYKIIIASLLGLIGGLFIMSFFRRNKDIKSTKIKSVEKEGKNALKKWR